MNSYYTQSPLARRATVPISVAPTAPMIDPNLGQYSIQSLQQQQTPRQTQQSTQQSIRTQNGNSMQIKASSSVSPSQQLQSPVQNSGLVSPSLNQYAQQQTSSSQPMSSDRVLPSQDTNEQNMDDAYIQFIMYCNPSIPLGTDATELRRGFRTPPKSEGKEFSTYTLFGLLARLERKDGITTWGQLVLEFGVAPPDQEKDQSPQKIQQYAVRLKRWLHAFHIDAFFGYLLGRPAAYQLERPMSKESAAETARDGVLPADDLVLRALLPEWRPKRGRRKADEIEADELNPSKRQNLQPRNTEFRDGVEELLSATPSSGIPWGSQNGTSDAWAAAQAALGSKTPSSTQTATPNMLSAQSGGAPMSWRGNSNVNAETPPTPHPHSAITPRHAFNSPQLEEPRSAHPSSATGKSPLRSRGRRAPAVSSAWPSTSVSGKTRGRPSATRSTQDGPFSTFPANPPSQSIPEQTSAPSNGFENTSQETFQGTGSQADVSNVAQQVDQVRPAVNRKPSKPSKLQLQVPAHAGGPVRLATPPRVLINGEHSQSLGQAGLEASSKTDANGEGDRSVNDSFDEREDSLADDIEQDQPELDEEGTREYWKRKAFFFKWKLAEKEKELKSVKRKVLDAVM